MPRTRVLLPAAIAALFVIFAWHWLPSRQARLHQDHLQKAVEERNWKKVGEFLSADYADRWGQKKSDVMERLPKVFQDFLAVGILDESSETLRDGDGIVLRRKLKLAGSGGPIAQFVMSETGRLNEPFSFTWRRESWKPWDWKLARADQPEIEIPADSF